MRKTILVCAACLIAVCSCVKQNLELAYANQEGRIDEYVKGLVNKDESIRVTTNKGSNRVTLVEGSGDELNGKGTVSFFFAGYIFDGSLSDRNLFATNNKEFADGANWNITEGDFDIKTMSLTDDEMLPGLKNGLIGAKGGEECYIIFSGKYGYGKRAFGMIPANSALLYHIWVQSISND